MAEVEQKKVEVINEEKLRTMLKEKGVPDNIIDETVKNNIELINKVNGMLDFLSTNTDTTFEGIDLALVTVTPLALDLADLSITTKGFLEYCHDNIISCFDGGMTPFDIIASNLMIASILTSSIRDILNDKKNDNKESKSTEELIAALKNLSADEKAKIIASLMK